MARFILETGNPSVLMRQGFSSDNPSVYKYGLYTGKQTGYLSRRTICLVRLGSRDRKVGKACVPDWSALHRGVLVPL